jgi:APA family basic amino acid/polyamine antiporter
MKRLKTGHQVGGEVQDSRRTLPWALTVGVLMVVGLYVAVNLAYLHALPLGEILAANSTAHPTATSVASRAAMAALGPRAGTRLPLLFMISAVGIAPQLALVEPNLDSGGSQARGDLLSRCSVSRGVTQEYRPGQHRN